LTKKAKNHSVYLACARCVSVRVDSIACARIGWKNEKHSVTLACASRVLTCARSARNRAEAARSICIGKGKFAHTNWIWREAKLARKSESYKSQAEAQCPGSEFWRKD
jgi:hypothetical protein